MHLLSFISYLCKYLYIELSICSCNKSSKSKKDNMCIKLLKTDVITAGNVFTDLFSDIWTTNEIPRDWNKGLIVKIPKKGDLQNCDNWRGITLLSMPIKIFCRVLLNRIEGAIDVKNKQDFGEAKDPWTKFSRSATS